jgi:predicted nucleic acid-binding protein
MTNTILVDAGPLIALFDKDDFYHKSIKKFMLANDFQLMTTTAVITETSHMLDFNIQTQIDFLGVYIHDLHGPFVQVNPQKIAILPENFFFSQKIFLFPEK